MVQNTEHRELKKEFRYGEKSKNMSDDIKFRSNRYSVLYRFQDKLEWLTVSKK